VDARLASGEHGDVPETRGEKGEHVAVNTLPLHPRSVKGAPEGMNFKPCHICKEGEKCEPNTRILYTLCFSMGYCWKVLSSLDKKIIRPLETRPMQSMDFLLQEAKVMNYLEPINDLVVLIYFALG